MQWHVSDLLILELELYRWVHVLIPKAKVFTSSPQIQGTLSSVPFNVYNQDSKVIKSDPDLSLLTLLTCTLKWICSLALNKSVSKARRGWAVSKARRGALKKLMNFRAI